MKNNDYERFTFKQKVWMSVAALVVVCIAALAFVLLYFRVTKVEVIGNSHYTAEEIQDMVLTGGVKDNSILISAKYRNKSIGDIPFIESMDVEVLGHNSIRIMVYEKSLAGCVTYLGNYMYFDREGIVVESAPIATEGVPEITGLHFDYVQLYQTLPVENEDIFKEILTLTQLLSKYEICADKIYFDPDKNVTLHFGQAKVRLGNDSHIDEKIMQLSVMVSAIEGKSGVLDMSDFSENTKTLTFEPDK
ncbi:MAG: FtsQ-type POTRA domain-containing protein [Lachnospiraceae bacterium]|nr:FtsQ-type POTRA domain-containing protein [Lachnospiraceae bacterium]